jgi:DNA gyrase subunit A
VRNYDITNKTGKVIAALTVNASQELIVISRDGIVIRTRMDSIRMTGRAAQGVSVINVAPGDSVASLATIDMGANGNGGPKGKAEAEPAEQAPLAGLESPAAGKKPATKAMKAPQKKPTPIRGGKPPQKPPPKGKKPRK